MECEINSLSFVNQNDYLDVDIHHCEKWIELKIETTESFSIESQEQLDFIYLKLSEILKKFEKEL
jgi:hypothetical protein